jgi:hypothetical protein
MEFVPARDVFWEWGKGLKPVEFHDVVQWLKVSHYPLMAVLISFQVSPNPQNDLIDRWQGYLKESMDQKGVIYTDEESMDQEGVIYTDDRLEMRWKRYLTRK